MLLPAIAEDKQRAALRIFAQAFLGRGPQPVEAGAQIARRRGHEYFQVRLETQHGIGVLRAWSRRAARASWSASVIRTRACGPSSSTSSTGVSEDDNSTCTKPGADLAWA